MTSKPKTSDTSIVLDLDTYYWLRDLQILPELEARKVSLTQNATGIQLTDATLQLETAAGVLHKQALQVLSSLNNNTQIQSDLALLSDSTTETAKLANWRRLTTILAAFPGVGVASGTVDEIMRGNSRGAGEVLNMIWATAKRKGLVLVPAKAPVTKDEGEQSSFPGEEKVVVRVTNLSEKSDFSTCESLLEFFCLAAAKETGVKPVQILSLFKDSYKNWAALLIKGKNGDQKPVVRILNSVLENFSTLTHLLRGEYDSSGVSFTLDVLKPALSSKDIRVASQACKAIAKVVEFLHQDDGPMAEAWESFTKVYGVFLGLFECFDTFADQVLREVFAICRAIGKFNSLGMFKDEFRKMLPDPKNYAMFLNQILTYYLLDDMLVGELIEEGTADHIMRYALTSLEKPNSRDIQTYYQAMIELVCRFIHAAPTYFTSRPQLASSLLNQIKQSVIDSLNTGRTTLTSALVQVADLLPVLASGRSSLSPALFKLLCQLYVLSCKVATTRGYGHSLMAHTLQGISTLPSDIVLNLALDWAEGSLKSNSYDSQCCPAFFELLLACVGHNTAQAARCDEVLERISLWAPRFKYFPVDWGKLFAEIARRFGREILNGGNKSVINLCCQIYTGLVAKQRQIDALLVQPGGVSTPPATLGSFVSLHHLVKDYKGAQWGNSQTMQAILHTIARVQMFSDGEISQGLYLAIDSGWGKPEARIKSYNPPKISSSILSHKDLHAELSALGGTNLAKQTSGLDNLPQSESVLLDSGARPSKPKKPLKKPSDKKKAHSRANSAKKESILGEASDPTGYAAEDEFDMFGTAQGTRPGSVTSPEELPGYMKGMVLDPDIIKMRRFDEILKLQEEQQRAVREKRERERSKRLKEIKEALRKEREEAIQAHVLGGGTKSLLPIPRANGRLIRSANISKGDTARKLQEQSDEVKREQRRQKRHMQVKAAVEARRQEILESKAKNEAELAHQAKVKELMKAKLAESKAFIKAEKEKLQQKSQESVFLTLLRDVFEKSREQTLSALPGRRMEKMRSKFEKGIQKRAKENALKESLLKLLNSEGAKMIFKQNEETLKVVFEFLSNIDREPKTTTVAPDKRVQCRTFFEFANMFGFVPLIMQVDDLKVIYRGVTKGQTIKWNTTLPRRSQKTLALSTSAGALRSTLTPGPISKAPDVLDHEMPIGLDFLQFKDILLRMSLKKKPTFDKTVADNKPDEVKITYPVKTQFEDFSGKNFFDKDEMKRLEEIEETYSPKDLQEFHYLTLEGLFNFMKLPYDPENVKKKLVFMRSDYLKNVRPKDHRTRRRPQANKFERLVEEGEERRERKMEDSLAAMIGVLRDKGQVETKSRGAREQRDKLLQDRSIREERSRGSEKTGATSTLVKEKVLVEEKKGGEGTKDVKEEKEGKKKEKKGEGEKGKTEEKEKEKREDKGQEVSKHSKSPKNTP